MCTKCPQIHEDALFSVPLRSQMANLSAGESGDNTMKIDKMLHQHPRISVSNDHRNGKTCEKLKRKINYLVKLYSKLSL